MIRKNRVRQVIAYEERVRMSIPNESYVTETIELAEHILSASLGSAVRLGAAPQLDGSDRSHVFRLSVLDGPADAPASVIVKRAAVEPNETYDPDASAFSAPAWRLFNDWAGLQFLSDVSGSEPLAPRLYGGNRNAGLIVLEDLGTGETLAQLLLGDDARAAERGLVDLAVLLGRMHALTIGRQAEFDGLRDTLGLRDKQTDYYSYHWLATALHGAAHDLAVTPAPGVDDELAALIETIKAPGPFLAYTHGDPCPRNDLRIGAQLRLLDFEFGDFRHALTDGVYGRILFPTCWCSNRLPPSVMLQMEAAYRAMLMQGCSAARDDVLFAQAVVAGCAYWALTMYAWNPVPDLLGHDQEWGIATSRQRVLARSEICAQAAEEFGYLEAIGATLRAIVVKLRSRLPGHVASMPFYPAFQEDGASS
jgi:hypothetical protein